MRISFPTDEHRPFHDERAVELAQRIVSDFSPELLIVGSDGMDFYAVSHFDKNPERMKSGLQTEVDQWQEGQRAWRSAAPNARRIYIRGNHEDRLRKYLWRHPELYGLKALELPNLLDFSSLGIEDSGNDEVVIDEALVIRHGEVARKLSAMSARAEVERDFYAISTMTGHTHRGGTFYTTTRNGLVIGQECFCLCRMDPEYMDHPNWQQGIVLAEVNGGDVHIEPIPFSSFRDRKVARWRGKEYIA